MVGTKIEHRFFSVGLNITNVQTANTGKLLWMRSQQYFRFSLRQNFFKFRQGVQTVGINYQGLFATGYESFYKGLYTRARTQTATEHHNVAFICGIQKHLFGIEIQTTVRTRRQGQKQILRQS